MAKRLQRGGKDEGKIIAFFALFAWFLLVILWQAKVKLL